MRRMETVTLMQLAWRFVVCVNASYFHSASSHPGLFSISKLGRNYISLYSLGYGFFFFNVFDQSIYVGNTVK